MDKYNKNGKFEKYELLDYLTDNNTYICPNCSDQQEVTEDVIQMAKDNNLYCDICGYYFK